MANEATTLAVNPRIARAVIRWLKTYHDHLKVEWTKLDDDSLEFVTFKGSRSAMDRVTDFVDGYKAKAAEDAQKPKK